MWAFIDRLLGRPHELPRLTVEPDPRGVPGTRVYHEMFVGSASTNEGVEWMVRVYGPTGLVDEKRGFGETDRAARVAAIAWAEQVKKSARGEV